MLESALAASHTIGEAGDPAVVTWVPGERSGVTRGRTGARGVGHGFRPGARGAGRRSAPCALANPALFFTMGI